MFILGIMLLILSLAVLFVVSNDKKRIIARNKELERRFPPDVGGHNFFITSSFFGVIIAVILTVSSFIAIVPPGHTGVQILFGAVQKKTLSEGLSIVNPFVAINNMSGRTQTYTMSGKSVDDQSGEIVALSSDGLRIPMDITIVYRLDMQYASWILQNIGFDYEDIIVKPASRTAVRQAAANFNAQEAYATKREELARLMATKLTESIDEIFLKRGFNNRAIHIEQVLLRNVDLPETVKAAIEDKLKAEQESQRMDFVIERETKEAKRKEIEAVGIQKFQEIVKKGIDENLLRWKGIETTEKLAASPNSKFVIIGGKDGLPVILNPEK